MISSVLFIRGIKLLGKADTARKGNLLSSVGMLIAVVTVLFEKEVTSTISFGISSVRIYGGFDTIISYFPAIQAYDK